MPYHTKGKKKDKKKTSKSSYGSKRKMTKGRKR